MFHFFLSLLNGQRQWNEHPRLCPFGAWRHLLYTVIHDHTVLRTATEFLSGDR